MLTDEESISGNSSGSKDYDQNTDQPVRMCIQYGGGKRGRSGKDEAEDRSRRCAEEVRTFLMRVQATGASGHAVSYMCNDLETCVNISKARPDKVFSELLATLDKNDYKNLNKTLGNLKSKNPEAKFSVIANLLFKNRKTDLEDAEYQIKSSKSILPVAVEMCMVSQYGDEAGNVQWSMFWKELTDLIEGKKSRRDGSTNTEGAGGDENDDDDDEDDEMGAPPADDSKPKARRGRPPKIDKANSVS